MSDTIVLCYHALSDEWPAPLSVRPDLFERQIDLLLGRGYRPKTFSDAVLSPGTGGEKTLVVTFDDGFRSVTERALPVLDRLGVPGTIFAVSSFAGAGDPLAWEGIEQWRAGPHESELASLDWAGFRDLQAGGWEVGSHTVSHPRLTRLGADELARELAESREQVSAALGRECTAIAYPYGDVDQAVVRASAEAGYAAGAALPARRHRPRHLEWPRVGVYHDDDMSRFQLKISRAVRAARLLLRR